MSSASQFNVFDWHYFILREISVKCNPILEGVNASGTGDETHSLSGYEPEDVGGAAGVSSTPITSEEVIRQIKAATDSLTRELERL